MRTKTLLIAAAALAAGVFASQAQSNVYSANVVGYVNATVTNSYSLMATPLDNNGSNDLNSILPLPNKSTVQTWNGSGFTVANRISGAWSPDTVVAPGTGFFVKLNSGGTNNTFVGQVLVNNGGSVTNSLPSSYVLVGSPIPYADDLNDTNNYLGLGGMPNKSTIQIWNGTGYTVVNKGATGWSPDETITPGEGFFLEAHAATNWVQSLNLQ